MSESSLPYVFIDLGSSLTKVVYCNGEPHVLLLPPHITSVSERRIKAAQDANPGADPTDLAWLKTEEGFIAIGNFAQALAAEPNLKERKMKDGLLRVLAVLGILQQKLWLDDSFECYLGVALPVAEYADRDAFVEQIKIQAESFNFQGRSLSCSFPLLDVAIEGLGLVRDRRAELAAAAADPKKKKTVGDVNRICAIMAGHRNLSIIAFNGSTVSLEQSRSSGPGFIQAVHSAARELSIEPTNPELPRLIAEGVTSYRFEGSNTARDLTAAIAAAKEDYWEMTASYLRANLPGGEFEVVVSGGAAVVIRDELESFFSELGMADRVSFSEPAQERLIKFLGNEAHLKGKLSLNSFLCIRLLDAFIGLQTIMAKASQMKASQTQEKQFKSAPKPALSQAPSDKSIKRLTNYL